MIEWFIRHLRPCLPTLEKLSPTLTAFLLFCFFRRTRTFPFKEHEKNILKSAKKEVLRINSKRVAVYVWGETGPSVLLVHGWESRASKFHMIIKALLRKGCRVISFDAPGHGSSSGKTTNILECSKIMLNIQEKYGNFDTVIAHSLGVLHLFYALKQGLMTKKIIAISGICEFSYLPYNYSLDLKLSNETLSRFKRKIELFFKPLSDIWNIFSADHDAEKIKNNIFIIHDKSDMHVNSEQSAKIYFVYRDKASICYTDNLGHFQILTNAGAIDKIISQVNGC